MENQDTLEKEAHCHCGIITLLVRFKKSTIPFDSYICHCDTCRHVSGDIAFSYLPIQGPPLVQNPYLRPVDPDSTDLTGYRVSDRSIRYFCANCSAHMFFCTDQTEWHVASAAVEVSETLSRVNHHIWVADTMDGGLADQLRKVDDCVLPRYAQEKGSQELPLGWRSAEIPSKAEAYKEETLNAYCHCGANRFYITRPNHLSAAPRAPYPELLFPKLETRLATMRNPKDEKWWLSPRPRTASTSGRLDMKPSANTKYLAGHCVCSQCRSGGGFEVHSWAFVPRSNIFEVGSAEPVNFLNPVTRPRSLKRYRTNPGRFREFCATCGATAFWWTMDRAEVIDISIGLLDQRKDGVRTEEWMKWHARLSLAEKAGSRAVIQGLADGMAAQYKT